MENKNIDNINNPNHYKLDCGVESIEIIKLLINPYENQLLKVGGKIRKPNKEVRQWK